MLEQELAFKLIYYDQRSRLFVSHFLIPLPRPYRSRGGGRHSLSHLRKYAAYSELRRVITLPAWRTNKVVGKSPPPHPYFFLSFFLSGGLIPHFMGVVIYVI